MRGTYNLLLNLHYLYNELERLRWAVDQHLGEMGDGRWEIEMDMEMEMKMDGYTDTHEKRDER